jgi:hypothetical protein
MTKPGNRPRIEHRGKQLHMKQLAALTGISYFTLHWRYRVKGLRGEDLVAPVNVYRSRTQRPEESP